MRFRVTLILILNHKFVQVAKALMDACPRAPAPPTPPQVSLDGAQLLPSIGALLRFRCATRQLKSVRAVRFVVLQAHRVPVASLTPAVPSGLRV